MSARLIMMDTVPLKAVRSFVCISPVLSIELLCVVMSKVTPVRTVRYIFCTDSTLHFFFINDEKREEEGANYVSIMNKNKTKKDKNKLN